MCWECSLRGQLLARAWSWEFISTRWRGSRGRQEAGPVAEKPPSRRPQGFPCKIRSRFELYKNRLLLPFTCDGVSFFNDVFAAVLSKRIIINTQHLKKNIFRH